MRPSTLDFLDKARMLINKEPDWEDPELINRIWSKDDIAKAFGVPGSKVKLEPKCSNVSPEARRVQTEIYDSIAATSSIIPCSIEEHICNKIDEAVKTAVNKLDYKDYCNHDIELTNKISKENTNMPTKNHQYECPRIHIDGIIPRLELNVELNTNKKEYNTMYSNNRKPKSIYIKPTGIIRRDDTTRVDWEDGTHTVIVRDEKSPELDMFYTFCIAFTKKIMGSTGAIMNAIKANDTDAIEKARAEAIAEANKKAEEEAKKMKEAMEKAEFEAAVQAQMFDHKVREEAIRRIMAKEEKEANKTNKIIDKFLKE